MYLVFVIYCTPPGNCCRCLNDENQIQSSMPQITITYPKNNLNQLFSIKTRKFRIKESNVASVKRMVCVPNKPIEHGFKLRNCKLSSQSSVTPLFVCYYYCYYI